MGKPHTIARFAAAVMAVAPWCAFDAEAATDRYRVELLVFRHAGGGVTEPASIERLRGFHDRWTLDETNAAPGAPLRIETAGTFETLYRRLERLADYTPLTLVSWEQPAMDYQPGVRIHDTEIVREDLYFPTESTAIDLEQPRPFDGHAAPLYRLDGTAQLRHSRFLHVDLDLEWRVDAPPESPVPEQGLALESETPGDGELAVDVADPGPEPDPFRVHRLRQSRQVETDTLIYFDSDVLGALARVTALVAE